MNLYGFVGNRVWGLDIRGTGENYGGCVNASKCTEWAVVSGKWVELAPNMRIGGLFDVDCDGMTCGGQFFKVKACELVFCRGGHVHYSRIYPWDSAEDRAWTPTRGNSYNRPPVDGKENIDYQWI